MIMIPNKMLPELNERLKHHTAEIAACNVYFQMARMANGLATLLDRNTYQEIFINILSDIELVTPPTDAFVPVDNPAFEAFKRNNPMEDGETPEAYRERMEPTWEAEKADYEEKYGNKLFVVNQLTPEYVAITEKLPIHAIETIFEPTSALMILIKHDQKKLEEFYDDLYIWYNMFKYLDMIDMIRLETFSNFNYMIEWIVNNVNFKDWQEYLTSNRVNEEKYALTCENLIFNPDIAAARKFYFMPKDENIPQFDVVNLMQRVVTNMRLKSDVHIVLATYLIIIYAMIDINAGKYDSESATYVREILSKL
jgi:hypothetical protein